jgi:hypothetical protein
VTTFILPPSPIRRRRFGIPFHPEPFCCQPKRRRSGRPEALRLFVDVTTGFAWRQTQQFDNLRYHTHGESYCTKKI